MKQSKSIKADSTVPNTAYHTPVMLAETIEALQINPEGVYVDCTFGGGGHSKAILGKLNQNGKLIVFDQDEDARSNVPADPRILFIPQNFRHLQRFLKLHKYPLVDGVLADLGVSSHQFDIPERGFSTRFEGPLDMRMDKRQEITAADILSKYSEQHLHRLFEQYGEVTNSRTLARVIVERRATTLLKTVNQFREAIKDIVKGNPNKYFSQVFQALRIEVNDELNALKDLLQQGTSVLKPGGRLVFITFHSLEDRLVKNFFREGSFETMEDSVFGNKPLKPLKVITKKPLVASQAELQKNPRARSAKLRIAEKT